MRWWFLLLFLFLFHYLSHCVALHTESRWDDGSCSCSCSCSIILAIASLFTQNHDEIQFPVPLSQSLHQYSHRLTIDDGSCSCSCSRSIISTIASLFTQNHDEMVFLALVLVLVPFSQSLHHSSHRLTMRWWFLLLFLFHYLNHCVALHTESRWDKVSCSIISVIVSFFTQTHDEIKFLVLILVLVPLSQPLSITLHTDSRWDDGSCSFSCSCSIIPAIKYHSSHRLTMRWWFLLFFLFLFHYPSH